MSFLLLLLLFVQIYVNQRNVCGHYTSVDDPFVIFAEENYEVFHFIFHCSSPFFIFGADGNYYKIWRLSTYFFIAVGHSAKQLHSFPGVLTVLPSRNLIFFGVLD